MSGGFHTGVDLATFASRMRGASDGLEALVAGMPSAPDAGAATGSIASVLATLVDAAGALSVDAQESATRLDESGAAYDAADQWAASSIPGARQ